MPLCVLNMETCEWLMLASPAVQCCSWGPSLLLNNSCCLHHPLLLRWLCLITSWFLASVKECRNKVQDVWLLDQTCGLLLTLQWRSYFQFLVPAKAVKGQEENSTLRADVDEDTLVRMLAAERRKWCGRGFCWYTASFSRWTNSKGIIESVQKRFTNLSC